MKKPILNTMVLMLFLLCAAGHARAEFSAGLRAYQQRDYENALIEFRDDNSAEAKYYLSMMYDRGDGVVRDSGKAFEWMRRAAEQGLDIAQANLGISYCQGYHVGQDMAEGLRWLRMAAKQGLEEAQSVIMLATAILP